MFALLKRLEGARGAWTDTGIRYERTSTERVLREKRAAKGYLVVEVRAERVGDMTGAPSHPEAREA